MSLSDCIKCWDTPCECGWEYRWWDIERLTKLRDTLTKIIEFKAQNPDAKLSGPLDYAKPDTEDDKRLMGGL